MKFSPSATAAATAALIQSTKNLSITTSIETEPSLSKPLSPSPSSSSTSLSSSYSNSNSNSNSPEQLLEVPTKPDAISISMGTATATATAMGTATRQSRRITTTPKKPFRPSKRQQSREKAVAVADTEPTVCCSEEDSERRHRQPSVYVPPRQDFMFNPNAWSDLSEMVYESERTKEVVLEWDECIGQEGRLVEIARVAVDRTEDWFDDDSESISSSTSRMFRMLNLASSLRTFVKHCRSNLTNVRSYKLKIAVLPGAKATRCPLWHADNVPLRWIQTYAGVGCVFLNEEAHNRETGIIHNEQHNPQQHNIVFNPFLQRVRESDHDKEAKKHGRDWKNRLVELSGVPVSQSATGEPAILVGRKWNSWANSNSNEEQQHDHNHIHDDDHNHHPQRLDDKGPMAGVLHRSPRNNPSNQARVLLNLDVVCHHDHNDQQSKAIIETAVTTATNTNKKKENWFQRKSNSNNKNNKKDAKKNKTKDDCACGPNQKCPCPPTTATATPTKAKSKAKRTEGNKDTAYLEFLNNNEGL